MTTMMASSKERRLDIPRGSAAAHKVLMIKSGRSDCSITKTSWARPPKRTFFSPSPSSSPLSSRACRTRNYYHHHASHPPARVQREEPLRVRRVRLRNLPDRIDVRPDGCPIQGRRRFRPRDGRTDPNFVVPLPFLRAEAGEDIAAELEQQPLFGFDINREGVRPVVDHGIGDDDDDDVAVGAIDVGREYRTDFREVRGRREPEPVRLPVQARYDGVLPEVLRGRGRMRRRRIFLLKDDC